MFASHVRPSRAGTIVVTTFALAILVAACGGATPPSPAASSSPVPAIRTSAPAATPAGATDFSAWTERQGFGGSSGLRNVAKLVHWIKDHPAEETLGNLDDEAGDITRLSVWLDTHPPTACWADLHTSVRASLATLAEGYASARSAVESGVPIPADLADAMVEEADKALAMTAPADCP